VCVAAGIILHRKALPVLTEVGGVVSRLIVAVVPVVLFVAIPTKVAGVLLIMSALMRAGLHTEAVLPVVEVLILEVVLLRVVVLHEVVVPFVPVAVVEAEGDNKTFRLDI